MNNPRVSPEFEGFLTFLKRKVMAPVTYASEVIILIVLEDALQLWKLVSPPLILQTTSSDIKDGKELGSLIWIKLPEGNTVLGVKITVKSVNSPALVGKPLILWKITVPYVKSAVKSKESKFILLLINLPVEVLVSTVHVLAVLNPVGLYTPFTIIWKRVLFGKKAIFVIVT